MGSQTAVSPESGGEALAKIADNLIRATWRKHKIERELCPNRRHQCDFPSRNWIIPRYGHWLAFQDPTRTKGRKHACSARLPVRECAPPSPGHLVQTFGAPSAF